MQISDIPTKFASAFANAAGAGYIRAIPATPSGTLGQAALSTGFPPENFNPVSAGGVPPFGQDFNGLLNQVTAWNRWVAAGCALPPYDATFQTAVGGYPKYAVVSSLVSSTFFMSIADNNVTNPDTGGAGWIIFWRRQAANTDVYVNTSTGNDSNNGLTPSTATKSISAALLIAWSFPPSQYTVTVHVAAGTYNEAVGTPSYQGPNLVIDGGSASTTTIVAPANYPGMSLAGPNTATFQNITVQTSGTVSTAHGFVAGPGATLTLANTASNAIAGGVFLANNGGHIFPGNHSYNGNIGSIFNAQVSSLVKPNGTHTFASAITVTNDTVVAQQCGQVDMGFIPGQITFVNPGNVTGPKYSATLNGVIVATGLGGPSSLPGTVAGSTATGGQAV